MKDVIIALFGDYAPVMTAGVIEGVPTDVVAAGVAGVDWQWLAGVLLFAIAFYSLFRIVGGLMKR